MTTPSKRKVQDESDSPLPSKRAQTSPIISAPKVDVGLDSDVVKVGVSPIPGPTPDANGSMDLDSPPSNSAEHAANHHEPPLQPSMDIDPPSELNPPVDGVKEAVVEEGEDGDVRELEDVAELTGHTDRAWSVAWHPTLPMLASCSTDRQIRLYNYSILSSHSALSLNSSPNAKNHSSSFGTNSESRSLKSSSPKLRFDFSTSLPTGHQRTVRSLSWHPTGSSLAAASFDATASIWERVGELPLSGPSGGYLGDQWEVEEERAAASAENPEWECTFPLEGHESECKGVAWAASGAMVATCSRDKSVWVWEALPDGEFEVLAVLMDHEQDVKSVTWHPTEDLLCSTSYDDSILLYAEDVTADDFSVVHRLTGHTSTVWGATFSPCGEFLASCSDDLTIRLWAREKRSEGGVEGRDGGKTGGGELGGVRGNGGGVWL